MNGYRVISKNIYKCDNCKKDIDKFNKFYMFRSAENKNNGFKIYLCKECKDKLKNILNKEID